MLIWAGKHRPERAVPEARIVESFCLAERERSDAGTNLASWPTAYPCGGLLFSGDNNHALAHLIDNGFRGRVKLVYIDPPFSSGSDYGRKIVLRGVGKSVGQEYILGDQVQYTDVWPDDTYLQFIYERLLLLYELLMEGGSIYLHCDYRRAHHLRCLLDEVFGSGGFRNQIIWSYSNGARGAKAIAGQFARNHDVILWYGKGLWHGKGKRNGERDAFHPSFSERRVPISEARRAGYLQDASGRWFKTAPRGDYTDESVVSLEKKGRIHRTKNGSVRVKYFLRQDGDCVVEDVQLGDVWSDIPDAMHLPEDEQTGFRTQKPQALLERIIRASSDPGDLVLDCFVGSGTTLLAAQKLGRRWIGCDSKKSAVGLVARRIMSLMQKQVGSDIAVRPLARADRERTPEATNTRGKRRHSAFDDAEKVPAQLAFSVLRVGESDSSACHEGTGDSDCRMEVDIKRVGDKIVVAVEEFVSLPIMQRLLRRVDAGTVNIGDWRKMVDSVMIDVAYDGEVFKTILADVPSNRRNLVTGRYELEAPLGSTRVAVKIRDVLGQEALVVEDA